VTAPVSGLGIASTALRSAERRLEVVANNLANASTDGFKAERTFAHLLDAAQGAPTLLTRSDVGQGVLRDTGAPLDLAPAGERWVRGGSLTVDPGNHLTVGGTPLLGVNGPVKLPPVYERLTIQRNGLVIVDDVAIDRLRVERPADPASGLQHEPQGTFIPSARTEVPPAERKLRQGALEASNVEPVSTMVEMLGIQRHHALLERAIRVLDEARETASSQLGKPV
jgi:flagellar basal-body rod protein FlgF